MSVISDETDGDCQSASEDSTLQDIDLTDQAKKQFGFYRSIHQVFERYRQCIITNKCVTQDGQRLGLAEIKTLENNCKQVLNYVAENQSILDQSLPNKGPLIVCGLPRTGTSLLYNLLACDENSRAMTYTDMSIDIVPPIARSNSIQQQRRLELMNRSLTAMQHIADVHKRLLLVHPYFSAEEDYLMLRHTSYFVFFTYFVIDDDTHTDAWLQNEMSKHYAYDYHEVFLRMLNSVDRPSSHWLLKSPMHSLYFDTIQSHYPNARFIITHRRLDAVLPSLCSLSWTLAGLMLNQNDSVNRRKTIQRSCQLADRTIDCIMKFDKIQKDKEHFGEKILVHVTYDDLLENPIGVVHQIYDYFDLQWSAKFETTMKKWLEENPQGKYGHHSYSLEDFDLNSEDIKTRYADYTTLFLSK